MLEQNLLKGIPNSYFFVSRSQEVSLNVNNFTTKDGKCENLLGVTFHSKLTFDQHISDSCIETSRKFNALA